MSRHNIANILAWIILSFLIPAAIAQADIYKYQDKNGVIHFTNTPPPPPEKISNLYQGTPTEKDPWIFQHPIR